MDPCAKRQLLSSPLDVSVYSISATTSLKKFWSQRSSRLFFSSDRNDQSNGLVLTCPAEPAYAITVMILISQLDHVRLALSRQLAGELRSTGREAAFANTKAASFETAKVMGCR